MSNRYSYHYCVQDITGVSWCGIVLLTNRVIYPADLEPLKAFLSKDFGVEIRSVISLSFLGREYE